MPNTYFSLCFFTIIDVLVLTKIIQRQEVYMSIGNISNAAKLNGSCKPTKMQNTNNKAL